MSMALRPDVRVVVAGLMRLLHAMRPRSMASLQSHSRSSTCSTRSTRSKSALGYKLDGKTLESLPAVSQDLRRIEPVYATLPGWKSFNTGNDGDEFPSHRSASYVNFLSEQIGTEIGLVSTGPERTQTIIVHDSSVGLMAS